MSKTTLSILIAAVVLGLFGFIGLGGPIIAGLTKAIAAVLLIIFFLIIFFGHEHPDQGGHSRH